MQRVTLKPEAQVKLLLLWRLRLHLEALGPARTRSFVDYERRPRRLGVIKAGRLWLAESLVNHGMWTNNIKGVEKGYMQGGSRHHHHHHPLWRVRPPSCAPLPLVGILMPPQGLRAEELPHAVVA